ncbi:hypothetical protein AB205_0160810 [Aquarana catesbeiana]|uniref:Uncharacterized protein n=1 Tax=Aquarana catesbeiana TaxID=8400 RepID=A0A2G9SDI0_AQUCT|nr:hypothetical protein AB205_0160810 [Aquarana catesbeiana]
MGCCSVTARGSNTSNDGHEEVELLKRDNRIKSRTKDRKKMQFILQQHSFGEQYVGCYC